MDNMKTKFIINKRVATLSIFLLILGNTLLSSFFVMYIFKEKNILTNLLLVIGTYAAVILLITCIIMILFNKLIIKSIVKKFSSLETKKALDKLQEIEKRKAILLSNLSGMTYRRHFDGVWTMKFISEGCYKMTGYKPEILIENKEKSYRSLICTSFIEELDSKWSRTLESKTVFNEEYKIITASGEEKWVLDQGQGIYNEKGDLDVIEGVIVDITERKRREEEVQYLIYHDMLTSLNNMTYFKKQLEKIDKENQLPFSIMIIDINGLKSVNEAFGPAEGDKLIIKVANLLKNCCRSEDVLARNGGDEFGLIFPKTDRNMANEIINKIKKKCEECNRSIKEEAYQINISIGYSTKENVNENITAVVKTAEDYMYKRKLLELKSSHSAILSSIKTTMFEISHETEEHAERLATLSRAVGVNLNFTQLQLDELELLATLHDIGKVGIDNSVLYKTGKLTEEEMKEIKKHPEIGYRIAMASPYLMSVANYILYHHERWDGKGYPHGLKGEEIPLLSRIITIADAYDSMTQDRVYRKAISNEEAINKIKKQAGYQFDPEISKIFIKTINYLRMNEYFLNCRVNH